MILTRSKKNFDLDHKHLIFKLKIFYSKRKVCPFKDKNTVSFLKTRVLSRNQT